MFIILEWLGVPYDACRPQFNLQIDTYINIGSIKITKYVQNPAVLGVPILSMSLRKTRAKILKHLTQLVILKTPWCNICV